MAILCGNHIPIQTYTVFLFHSFLFTFYGLIPLLSHIHKRLATQWHSIEIWISIFWSTSTESNGRWHKSDMRKKKRLFGIQNKHLCSCYSGNFSPSSNFHINLMNAVFLDSHLLAILARLFETMLNKISLFICVWMENIQSQQWLRMRALRMCLAVVVRGIQWLEKKINGR